MIREIYGPKSFCPISAKSMKSKFTLWLNETYNCAFFLAQVCNMNGMNVDINLMNFI